MKNTSLIALCFILTFSFNPILSQEKKKEKNTISSALSGFKFRSLGPAFMSGRIADIAIDPKNQNTWYVAVGSGGVWKTTNAGTTWSPLTDNMPFYSTGCITIDPSDNSSIWLGTGENVGGRHVGIGHGIYHSNDGGVSWKDKGLKKSEHISKIIVHPKNANVIWVAAQGPLWSSGGQRGLYKSTDGGNTWKNTLEVNEWTGVTDLLIDPNDPSVLYAATWQRHRNVAALMGGGPGTAIYKSIDGGDSWKKINKGLPGSNLGKIGLAISPMKTQVLYAAIELDKRKGAVYRSENAGNSWVKMSETVSGGTGPHYYQELVASPHVFDKIFLMNVRVLVSDNGGKKFYTMSEKNKHSDNHALTFKKDDPNYLLAGSDGGVYESFDGSKTWKFVGNLPITQFYKLAVDDAVPFYNIYGGTQDNSTQGGPSRTVRRNGITNADWEIVLGGDGHQPATEPGNPNIVYAQSQEGYIHRIDRSNGEVVNIRPRSGIDDPYDRFNWDSPILVSQHDPKRLYFASQRVWRSENRGDSWKSISNDLTRNQERLALPIMGKVQSFENPWDVYAMSTYNTITSLAESKVNENVLYAGTDDGIIQCTKDGGQNWEKITVDKLPKTPSSAFVNDIKADLFDENTAYVALDNHKFGDYQPYLFKTTDGGKKWTSITNGIPEGTLIWRIVQDHINPKLLFLGTEYGLYVSLNQGEKWHKFSSGLPTIPVRDLAIQKRENDLVLATFGRSFYVLDDYSPLRSINEQSIAQEAILFSPRKTLQYYQMNGGSGSSGASTYSAKNPPYGAIFSYYLKDGFTSKKEQRKKTEFSKKADRSLLEKLSKAGYKTPNSILEENVEELAKTTEIELKKLEKLIKILEDQKIKDIPFPGWEALDAELNETKPEIVLVIQNSSGATVEQMSAPFKKGLNRVSWGLNVKLPTALRATAKNNYSDIWTIAEPGTYTVSMYKRVDGTLTDLGQKQQFEVERIRKNTLTNPMATKHKAYYESIAALTKKVKAYDHKFNKANKRVAAYKKSLGYVNEQRTTLTKEVYDLLETMNSLKREIDGSSSRAEVGEKDNVSLNSRLYNSRGGWYPNTYGPTELHMESFKMATELFKRLQPKVDAYIEKVNSVGKQLESAGAPVLLD
ncbi:MAG: glycosyl hydrolase [Parvicellaceae bacterium]